MIVLLIPSEALCRGLTRALTLLRPTENNPLSFFCSVIADSNLFWSRDPNLFFFTALLNSPVNLLAYL